MSPRSILRVSVAAAWAAGLASGQAIDFARDVLPILSDRCFNCHGPDEAARKADLRLDRREAVVAVRAELLARIGAEDPDERMPPVDSNLALAADEVAVLRRWIDAGAPWAAHWSFVPPAPDEPPRVGDAAWPQNDLDRFVLGRLEQQGLRPSPTADAATLLRRVTLDLTGVPPTPTELAAFVGDPGDAAYGRVVDALLASPRYGERMVWSWLQAARYADTDGYQSDPTRAMWPWRDWLIAALNANVPFDQLTIEMLAGDLLSEASPEQVLATGFNRNHAYNGEGGRIAEETRVENVFDRTETTATVWLGMTVECARCHDHKYDPITQREYYSLFAFFDQTSETGAGGAGGRAAPNLRYLSPSARARVAAIDVEVEELDRQMRAPDAAVDAAQAAWAAATCVALRQRCRAPGEESQPPESQPAETQPLASQPAESPSPLSLPRASLGSWRQRGPMPVVADPLALCREPAGWVETAAFVDGVVHALPATTGATYLHRVITAPDARTLEVSLGSDDGIRVWCNGELLLSKQVRRGAAADQEFVQLTLRAGDNDLLLEIDNTGGIGGFYFDARAERVAGLPGELLPLELAQALLAPAGDAGLTQLQQHYRREHSPAHRQRLARREQLARERDALREAAPVVMVMDELPRDRRRTSRVLERGGYDQPRTAVSPGTPSFLPPLEGAQAEGAQAGAAHAEGAQHDGQVADRLALARWLVAPDNPLVARVAVNRAWELFFGRGLVSTPEDFGRQGSAPSHPRLLDWLARRYVASGWDTKALHRLIVTSATYRQSAHAGRAAYEADPDNVLLARGPRFRMPSWMLRDQALALGGLLVHQLGGPPVRPYQPDGVWAEATFDQIRYQRDAGDALHRRSVYVFWRRIVGPTFLFDEPGRQACVVRRSRTNTPLHALTTWNDIAYVEAARAFAARAWRQGGDAAGARIAWAFRAATARSPQDDELQLLLRRFAAARAHFEAHPEDAAALLAVGDAPRDAAVPLLDHAAGAVIASILLNLDEVVTRP